MANPIEFRPWAEHGKHPDLQGRKRLAARLLIARNLSARPMMYASKPPGLADLLSTARKEASKKALIKDKSLPLDDFIKGVLEKIRDEHVSGRKVEWPDSSTGHNAVPLDDLLGEFEKDVSVMDCTKCVLGRLSKSADADAIRKAICDGTEKDIENLKWGALCWKPLTDLFNLMVAIAQKAYAPILQSDATETLQIEFRTRLTNESKLGAHTTFPDDDQGRRRIAIVQLTLPVDDFDHIHYLRLPYYIFHEVCVHAPEAWTSPEKRKPTNERCPFGEGFVDAAAVSVLTRALRRDAASEVLDPFTEQFIDEIEKAHHKRMDIELDKRTSDKERDQKTQDVMHKRSYGKRLFKRLADREDDGAVEEAIRIALGVNLLPLGPSERVQFLVRLDASSKKSPLMPPTRAEWMYNLRQAARRGNFSELQNLILSQADGQMEF